MTKQWRAAVGLVVLIISTSVVHGARVRGMLLKGEQPAANIKVELRTLEGQEFPSTYTDAEGFFYFEKVKEKEEYKLKFWVTAALSVERPIVVYSGPSTDITPIDLGTASRQQKTLNASDVERFIETYFELSRSGQSEKLADMYGVTCDFYDDGFKGRGYIAKRTSELFRYYPKREYTLLTKKIYDGLNSSEKSVSINFRYKYVSRLGKNASGKSRQAWVVKRDKQDIEIISCKEIVNRD